MLAGLIAGMFGGGAGYAVAAPVIPGMTVAARFDFGNAKSQTLSTGSLGGGGNITSIADADGRPYALTGGTQSGGNGTYPTSIMRNGRPVLNLAKWNYMQMTGDVGLVAAGQCVVVVVYEFTGSTSVGSYPILGIGNSAATFFGGNTILMSIGNDAGGIACSVMNGYPGINVVEASPNYFTAGPRCSIGYIKAGNSAPQLFSDSNTSSPTASGSTTFPTTINYLIVGARNDTSGPGVNTSNGSLAISQIIIYSTAPADAPTQTSIVSAINSWAWSNYGAYGQPVAAKTIQRPAISPITAGATSVTVTPGQMIGFPAPTGTLALSVNGALISSNYTSGAAIPVLNNGDRVDVVQTGTNVNGSGTNAALTAVVGAPVYAGVVNGIGVAGQPIGIYVPGVTNVAGKTITSYQWYKNYPGKQNTTGQQPWSTLATPTFTSADVGSVLSCEFVVNGVTYSTPTFGNTLPANVAGLAVGINPIPRTTPTTGTRPSSNTGSGIYTNNGEIYDSSNTRLTLRGVDAAHWDTDLALTTARALNPNVIRIFVDYTQNFATTNKLLMDVMVANHVIPMPTFAGCNCNFTGSVSAGVLTISATSVGSVAIGQTVYAGSTPVGTISAFTGTGSGKAGTYPLTGGVNTASTAMNTGSGTSGSQEPTVLAAVVSTWIDQVANWSAYDQHSIINLANEWGPSGSATNTVWRDSYVTQIARIRAAGYRGCVVIDAGGSGQDSYGPLNHFAAILAADPQHNVICSVHMYGGYPVGAAAPLLQQLNAVSSSTGACYVIGEFGPGNSIGPSPTNMEPLEIVYAADACNIGMIAWAYDDHGAGSPPDNNSWFGMVYNWYSGFQTGNVADLEYYGQKIVADPIKGLLTTAVKTTV